VHFVVNASQSTIAYCLNEGAMGFYVFQQQNDLSPIGTKDRCLLNLSVYDLSEAVNADGQGRRWRAGMVGRSLVKRFVTHRKLLRTTRVVGWSTESGYWQV